MKNLRIGIDIDNVIADTYTVYLDKFNREFTTDIAYEELIDFYYLEKRSGIRIERVKLFLETILQDEKLQLSYKPFTKAVKVIKNWLNNGFFIHYITARPSFMRKITHQWLKKNGFIGKNTAVHLFDSEGDYKTDVEFKKALSEKLVLDLFIEDAIEFVEKLEIPVLLIDRPWNRAYNLSKKVTRVKDWEEIDQFVKKYGKKGNK